MNPEIIAKIPKLYCENVLVTRNEEVFLMALYTGENTNAYVLSPEHAKRLLMSLEHNIKEFEKTSRKIETNWSPGVPSPFKIDDVKGE